MIQDIRKRLIVLLILALMLPLVISSLVTYFYTKNSIQEDYIRNTTYSASVVREQFEGYFRAIADLTLNTYYEGDFMRILEDKNNSIKKNRYVIISDMLKSLQRSRKEVVAVRLFLENSNQVYEAFNSQVFIKENTRMGRNPYVAKLLESDRRFIVQPPHPIELLHKNIVEDAHEYESVVTVHTKIKDVITGENLGVISYDISQLEVLNIGDILIRNSKERLLVVDEFARIVFDSEMKESGKLLSSNLHKKLYEQKQKVSNFKSIQGTFNGTYVIKRGNEGFQNWSYIISIPSSVLYGEANSVAVVNILILLIATFFAVFLTIYISLKVTKPIRTLTEKARQVSTGNMEVEFPNFGNNDFTILSQQFNHMLERIRNLIKNEYALKLENKTNELRVLQSQVNPHFLYNTLQSIGALAIKSNNRELYMAILSLSRIMRYSMEVHNDIVEFKSEIQHVRDYLNLQKQRFGDSLQYHIDCDPRLLNIETPKMILQPIVENFFKHGHHIRDEVGEIWITSTLENDEYWKFTIRDNGIGMSSEKSEALLQYIYSEDRVAQNIGLKNVYERMKMYYGPTVTVSIKTSINNGFIIQMIVPIEKE